LVISDGFKLYDGNPHLKRLQTGDTQTMGMDCWHPLSYRWSGIVGQFSGMITLGSTSIWARSYTILPVMIPLLPHTIS
jgi:hypothetical protein